MKVKTLALAWTFLLLTIPCSADVIYVKEGGTGGGTSWIDGYGDLQDGLDDAGTGDEIWVAEGTYKPTSDYGLGTGDRGKHFRLKNRVAIYGGFPPSGDTFESRDPNQFKTILSGDIGALDDTNDNCYHVFYHPDGLALDPNAILDGFIITGGNGNVSGIHRCGGGMYNASNSPKVSNCTFIENWAGDGRNGINGDNGKNGGHGGGMYNYYSSPIVSNCTFRENRAGDGGDGDRGSDGGDGGDGGGMYNVSSSPTVNNCTFSGNRAGVGGEGDGVGDDGDSGNGGGMFNASSNPTVTGCIFSGNYTGVGGDDGDGGGMINSSNSSPIVTSCIFIGNLSVRDGGGMYNLDSSNPEVTDCTFVGNLSGRDGGGMYNSNNSSPTVTNCTFDGNWTYSDWDGGGGGMYNLDSSSPTVTGCTFTGNLAAWEGGGMYNDNSSSPEVFNCTFTGNLAAWEGGGMYNSNNSSPTVINCTFSANWAYYEGSGGGGMYNDNSSSPTVTGCSFVGNAAYFGGGMFNNHYSDPTVTGCTFGGNSVIFDGGGMYNFSNSSPTVTNCTFGGNAAYSDEWGGGGGMYNIYYSNPTVINCTFGSNMAEFSNGGGIYNEYSRPIVTNCILWGNIATNGNEIYNDMSFPVISYCDIAGCGCSGPGWYTFLGMDGGGNIDVDPIFIDADGADNTPGTEDDNLRLQAGSLCIDAGDNSVVDSNNPDLDGNSRILDGNGDGDAVVDMGAYEFFYANTAPVADAGTDQTIFVWVDGMAEVGLDGSGSFDADGDELTYLWTWTIDANEMAAMGVDPNIMLPVGVHTIQLVVNDGTETSEPNEVVITVIGPIEADVHIVPSVINRQSHIKRIIAIVRLSEGIVKGDVVRESFELYAGGLDGEPVGAILERVIGWGNMTRVFALFDKAELMDAVEGVGRVELTVVGRLESGQCVYGSDTVRIVRPRRRRQGWLRRRW